MQKSLLRRTVSSPSRPRLARALQCHAWRKPAHWHYRKCLAGLGLVLAFAGLSLPAVAASQGEWGKSSTATARITLRILPRDDQPIDRLSKATLGHKALEAYCASPSAFNQTAKLFTASLPHHPPQGSGDLDQLLRASCEGGSAPVRSSAATSADDDQLTVLISPV